MAKARVVLERSEPLLDEPVSLHVAGLKPGEFVRIRAASIDARGVRYESWADYQTGEHGVADPARLRPLSGTYKSIDPFGLWWSMCATPDGAFARDLNSVPTIVSAELDGRVVACANFVRLRIGPGVCVSAVREAGVIGTLFLPASNPAAAVVVLGGSEGGVSQAEELAAALAARGFAALALAYFGVEDLPAELVNIPVEYLETAIGWLAKHPAVAAGGVGLVGASRGGELALLAASRRCRVRAVVGFSASGILWPGFSSRALTPVPAWTRRSKPLPFAAPEPGDSIDMQPGQTIVLREWFEMTLRNPSLIAKAHIPVERIAAPVLLISGGDDQMWPSHLFGELIMRRLGSRRFRDLHLTYARAGHAVGRSPGLPAAPTASVDARGDRYYALGGAKAANARSAAHAWPRVIAFLSEHLPPVGKPRRDSA